MEPLASKRRLRSSADIFGSVTSTVAECMLLCEAIGGRVICLTRVSSISQVAGYIW